MKTYIVSFEINDETILPKLEEILKKSGFYCPVNKSTWAIKSEKSAKEIRDELMKITSNSDRLFVIRSGTEAAWTNAYGEKNTEWLKNTSNMKPKGLNSEKQLRVLRGRVDSVNLYEVKENELELLEKGEPTGIYLNFSIFLLSIAFASILSLCTASFSNSVIQNAFVFIAIIGIIGGVFLIILWLRGRKSIQTVIKTIKERIPPDFVEAEIDDLNLNVSTSEEDINTKPPSG